MLFGLYLTCIIGSAIVYMVIMYEFLRIHAKRLVVVADMPEREQKILKRGRKRMVILYSVSLLTFHIYSSFVLFS